jgi:hypothetical protein
MVQGQVQAVELVRQTEEPPWAPALLWWPRRMVILTLVECIEKATGYKTPSSPGP